MCLNHDNLARYIAINVLGRILTEGIETPLSPVAIVDLLEREVTGKYNDYPDTMHRRGYFLVKHYAKEQDSQGVLAVLNKGSFIRAGGREALRELGAEGFDLSPVIGLSSI